MATTMCYLIVEPRFGKQAWNRDQVVGMAVARVVKNRPRNFKGVAVKLTLTIPDAAFKPLAPEVTIDVPEEALSYEPKISVEFPDADEEEEGEGKDLEDLFPRRPLWDA